MFTAHRKKKKILTDDHRVYHPPRSRNVAREHGTAQEPPRSQPLIQLSPLGMERSLATETSRKRIFQAFSRARWLYPMDGVVTCNEREREVGWKRGARVYVLVERSWYTGAPKPPRTTAGSATPLAACRRIPTTAPRPPPRFSIRVEGKMGGKVVRCMIGRLLDWYRSKGCFWFYLHCVDTFADDGGFFNGAEQSMEARIDDYLEIYIFFFYYRVLYLSCLVLWNFCTCTTASFFL